MRKYTMIFAVIAAMVLSTGVASAGGTSNGNAANSLGKTTIDTDVSAGINYGDGVDNGEWVIAEVQGIELGLRATDRTDGLLDVTGTNGNRVGVYEATTGVDGATNYAEWNYEWSVDLSGATGNASGSTLSDYQLVLEQDYTEQSLFGVLGSDPVMLPFGQSPAEGACDEFTPTLCQQSWNPTFGNADFDPEATGTYHLRLVLTPSTFSGPPLAVAIEVNVTEPAAP